MIDKWSYYDIAGQLSASAMHMYVVQHGIVMFYESCLICVLHELIIDRTTTLSYSVQTSMHTNICRLNEIKEKQTRHGNTGREKLITGHFN